MVDDPERVDKLAGKLHDEAFGLIDCTRCAHCCKTMRPAVNADDIERIAVRLELSLDEFAAAYLSEDGEGQRIKAAPCPFLGGDDRCTIYDVRPQVCREYPHTNKEGFVWRTYMHAENARTCPAVYYVVKQMRTRKRRR
jgi:Fe-S-cluster containining protein